MERFSKQREKILNVVVNTKSHPTADWIHREVRKTIPNISLGTVYRNLGKLVEHEIIRSHTISGVVRYDGNTAEHHHFICNQCGDIQDIDFVDEKTVSILETKTNNIVSDFQLKIRGICTICQKTIKSKKESV